MITPKSIPIRWFGNREAYERSALRVVTVGVCPSQVEFLEERFPDADYADPSTYARAWNAYFSRNPYGRWFDNYECLLRGLGASYYDDAPVPHRALHTDLCTPHSTTPCWKELKPAERRALMDEGVKDWHALIAELQPHLMLASIPLHLRTEAMQVSGERLFRELRTTHNGETRRRPVQLTQGTCHGTPVVMGLTRQTPFGCIHRDELTRLGSEMLQALQSGTLGAEANAPSL